MIPAILYEAEVEGKVQQEVCIHLKHLCIVASAKSIFFSKQSRNRNHARLQQIEKDMTYNDAKARMEENLGRRPFAEPHWKALQELRVEKSRLEGQKIEISLELFGLLYAAAEKNRALQELDIQIQPQLEKLFSASK